MASKSKTKGKSWERDVANFLTKLYDEQFLRVPNSGAFIGGYNVYRINALSAEQTRTFKGDIIPGPSFPRLVIECKNYADFPFHKLALNETIPQLDKWISQARNSCEINDKWLLCVKITRKAEFVIWNPNHFNCWDKQGSDAHSYKTSNYMEYNTFWNTQASYIKLQTK